MAVIAHIRIPAHAFELGCILDVTGAASISLESLIPLGEKAVPFFSVHGDISSTFEQSVQDSPTVTNVHEVSRHDDRVLYSLDWDIGEDAFFSGLREQRAQVLSGTGGPDTWEFELRFVTHRALAEFREYCSDHDISVEVGRIYNPARPEGGPFYGLTQPQRETLVRAVMGGYYSIPRKMSTKDLAGEFDISDQAVTERLRRAIMTLVENSLVPAIEQESAFD